ncbi:MAG: PTS lactose transporter subunit IIC [Firmicutes bacterium HGW-Firmicutes-1]|jgi:lactose/cellobiose-specific phosphotransferase system IIC component|nr:MAG: PTS lactose transporter subunit IIC [Firmicutes bacterium HGW-Firmicutes-1]
MYLANKIIHISDKINKNILIKSIRSGLILIIPLIIAGSISLIFNNLPIAPYQNFMNDLFGSTWKMVGDLIWNLTFGIMGLALSITVSFSFVSHYSSEKNVQLNPIIVALASMISFLIITNTTMTGLNTNQVGVTGVFMALLISLTSSTIFVKVHKLSKIRLKSFYIDNDSNLQLALTSILPFSFTLFVFVLLRYSLTYFGIQDINSLLTHLAVGGFENIDNPFFSGLLFVILHQVFWFFGIHGGNVLYSISDNIYMAAVHQNINTLVLNQEPIHILTKPFLDVFVFIGGAGSTLCLLFAIFIVAKKSTTAKMAKLSLLPALFNINEIIFFGLPIVLNPVFLIPYIFVPILLYKIAYLATAIGLVPLTIAEVNWTTPILLGGLTATGSWRGILLQLVNLSVGVAIYIPFVKMFEIQKDRTIKASYEKLLAVILNNYNSSHKVLSRFDDIGNIANVLIYEIKDALKNNTLYLEYQPQVNDQGIVTGVEVLLRWNHYRYGKVPPQLIIVLSEESGLIHELGRWIIAKSCSQLAEWKNQSNVNIEMCINISPEQLNDEKMLMILKDSIKKYNINPQQIELEITESAPLKTDHTTHQFMANLKDLGVKIAMDDFGMGYTSMLFMRNFKVDTIKLDGSLTKDVVKDKNCQEIISSMVHLANSLNVKVIAEYVETKEQQAILKKLGCLNYQGYLFSKPVLPNQIIEYLNSQHD